MEVQPFPESPETTSQRVLERVRTVLEERRARGRGVLAPQALAPLRPEQVEALEYYPWRRAVGSRDPLNIADLLDCPRELFVSRCYRLLLLRDPTGAEAVSAQRQLDQGWERLVLIARLRWSVEGLRAGVPMRSLKRRLPQGLTRSLRRRVRLHPRKAP